MRFRSTTPTTGRGASAESTRERRGPASPGRPFAGSGTRGDGLRRRRGLRCVAAVAAWTAAAALAYPDQLAGPGTAAFSAPDGRGADRFGAAVAASASTIVVGAPGHDHDGFDTGAAYVFVRRGDFPLPQTELRAADASPGAHFGAAVAMDGDTAAVGAPDAGGAGAVYVFERTRGVWTQTARLAASDAAAGVRFGAAIAVNGDTLAVGAPGSAGGAGGAYVFVRSGGTWTERARIGSDADARLGASVALAGGLLVVGAPGARGGAGAVRMYEGAAASWTLAASFSPSDLASGDEMGAAVAVSDTVVVAGAPHADSGASDAGAAHVFERLCGTWRRTARLTAPSPVAGAHFGAGVAAEGATVAVGAPGDVDRAVASGAAHLFRRTAEGWMPDAHPVAGDRSAGDGRGAAVALAEGACSFGAPEHAAGMGIAYVTTTAAKLVPAPGEAGELAGLAVAYSGDTALVGGAKGRAYVFRETAGAWSLEATLAPGDPAEGFGCSVGLEGDTAVVGARWDDDGGARAGAAYVFARSAGAWTQAAKLLPTDGGAGAWFGDSVAVAGGTVLVGSRSNAAYAFVGPGGAWAQQAKLAITDAVDSVAIDGDLAVLGSRRAYFFARSGTEWTLETTLENPVGSGTFGSPVALSGTTALIGWSGADFPPTEAVHVYDHASGTWRPEGVLRPAEGVPGIWFGLSVALDGDVAVVGAALDGDRDPGAGAAYVYAREHGVWRQLTKLTAPDGGSDDSFGRAVAVRGRTVVVGTPQDDTVATSSGAAWVMPVALPSWDGGVALPVAGSVPGFSSLAVAADTALVGSPDDDVVRVLVRSGGVWTPAADLRGADVAAGDEFGFAVALDGDTALVGTRYGGAAYVFVRSQGRWTEQAKLSVDGITGAEELGFAVALAGDTAVVCAPRALALDGAAYAFVRSGTTWSLQQRIVPESAAWEGFGRAVAIRDDVVLVGAPEDSELGPDSGAVYVFARSGGTWWQEVKLAAPDPRDGAFFGFPIAVEGDTALVGATNNGAGPANDAGAAYVCSRASGQWEPVAKLVPPDGGVPETWFGFSVALCGDTAAVGWVLDDDLGWASGSAYVFTRCAGTWTPQTKLVAPGGVPDGAFGLALAMSGDTLLVGAAAGATPAGTGPVYAFTRSLDTGTLPADPVPASGLPPAWTAGHAFDGGFTATSGTPPYQWRVVGGALPFGLALDARTGRVDGAAAETGAFGVTVECADALGRTAPVEGALTVNPTPDIAPFGPAPGVVGRPYLLSIERSGGTGPFAWTFDDGGAGLAFDPATAVAAGTPGEAGAFRIDVSATDAVGAVAPARSGTLRVLDLLAVPRGTLRFGVSADAGPRERVLELVGGTRLTLSARVPGRATAPDIALLDATGAPIDLGPSLRARRGATRVRQYLVPATGRYVVRITPTDTDPLAPVQVTVVLEPPESAACVLDLAAGASNAFEFSTLPGADAAVTVAARRGQRVAPEVAGVLDAAGRPIPFEVSRTARSVAVRLRDLPGDTVGILLTTRDDTSGRVTAAARIREPRGYDFSLPDLPAGR